MGGFEIDGIKAGSTVLRLFMDNEAADNINKIAYAIRVARDANPGDLAGMEFLDNEIFRSITEIGVEFLHGVRSGQSVTWYRTSDAH